MRADLPPGPGYPVAGARHGVLDAAAGLARAQPGAYGKRFTTRFPLSPYFVIIWSRMS